ncbi:MAG: DUF5372 family protein [Candidatus Sulfotelmatobacter sp.]
MEYFGSTRRKSAAKPWKSRRTTPGRSGGGDFFHVIHPFHPLAGQELERASGPPQESHRRVFFHTTDGRLSSIPLTFTDLVEADPFVAVSAGRAWMGINDLLRLAEFVQELGERWPEKCVKVISSHM